jgi:ankyrin repeat protein
MIHISIDCVKLLLNNKCDPNRCFKGESPLYIASDDGHAEIVKLLLNDKANPNIWFIIFP